MGEQTDSRSVKSTGMQLLEELVAGMDSAAAWTGSEKDMPSFDSEPVWEPWVIAGLLCVGCVLLLRTGWLHWTLRERLSRWPELTRFSKGTGDPESAAAELRMLELVAGLRHPESRVLSSAWNKLTPSEQVVAWGTIKEQTVQDLADELACTTSHVYNLRTSIRKKWTLDSAEPLAQAIRSRHKELLPNEGAQRNA